MNPELKMIDLESLIEARDFNTLRDETKNWPAADLAELMSYDDGKATISLEEPGKI